MRKGRIWSWIAAIIAALVLSLGEGFFETITAEKNPLYVYAPSDMETAFKRALKCAGLIGEYTIVMTDDMSQANCVVQTGKEFDSEYTKIAYTPFVVAYNKSDSNIKKMVKSGLLEEAFFDNDYHEINFNKVVEEVVEEGKWENFGLKDLGTMKVFYPAPETEYYCDYYDFMLVAVNGGIYPKNESDLEKAMEQIKRFEQSNYTEAVTDFEEKFDRVGGFMENCLYLIPEKVAGDLAGRNSQYGRLFYPTTTVYVNYYVKVDELGSKLVEVFDISGTVNGNFYDYLENENYRNSWDNTLESAMSSYLYEERDVYNVLYLDEGRIKPSDIEVKDEPPADTQKEETQPVS